MIRFVTMAGAAMMATSIVMVVQPVLAQRTLGSRSSPLQQLDQRTGVIEGKLTRVDGRSASVDVSIGLFGVLGWTLEVGRDTLIRMNGREARFADLREGSKVTAYYEERGAKLVATRLEMSTGT